MVAIDKVKKEDSVGALQHYKEMARRQRQKYNQDKKYLQPLFRNNILLGIIVQTTGIKTYYFVA